MKKTFIVLFLVAIGAGLRAQTVLENNPAGLKWYQINTPHFRVLYPKGFEFQAQRVANTLEHIHEPEARTLGSSPRKISIVLQNQSSRSNGFVSQIPRRSEFYTMPTQRYTFTGTGDWLNLLSSHEYRHVVQYQHALRGLNAAFYYVFGSTFFAATTNLAAPAWFFEGDAVATETAFTHAGRGRIPNFDLVFRTNLIEGRTFNYHKQYLRSYKHYIPDHYVLGYHMVSYLRKRTNDPDIWGKVTARSWNVPIIPFAFSNAIKAKSGMYVTKLYREMATDLRKEWQAEIDQLEITQFEKVKVRRNRAYTNFHYPQPMNDGSVLVMKEGIGDIEKYVLLKDGKETKVFTPGMMNDTDMISVAGDKIVWNEFGYHPRWLVKNYSLIKAYDRTTKRVRVIGSRHERYAGSALSPDGKIVVTTRSGNDYKNNIVLLDFASGNVIKEIPNEGNYFYSMPRWSEDSKRVVLLKNQKEGKSVVMLDVASGEETDLIATSQENIGYPVLHGNYLFFNSPVSGIDNIYVLNLTTRERYQFTSSKYGAYNPAISASGTTVYYNDQSANGLDVVSAPFLPELLKPWRQKEQPFTLYKHLVEQEGRPGLLDSVPATTLPVRRYSKLKGIVNPHSWGPYTENTISQVDFGVASRDILSTTTINVGYTFDTNERIGFTHVGVSYQGLFPILDFSIRRGDRSNDERLFGNDISFDWKETAVEGGIRIPLLLTSSKYHTQVTFGNAIGFTKTSSFQNTITRNGVEIYKGPGRTAPVFDSLTFVYKDQLNDGSLIYNKFTLSAYNLLKTSQRDFLPRWGQTLDVETYSTVFDTDFTGSLSAIRGVLYFPGIGKHHYFFTRFAYQESKQGIETDIYTFRNRIPKPRGHSFPNDNKFSMISVNYALPLWYPDISIGPILNLQRIKATLFYDYGTGTGRQYYYNTTSGRAYYGNTDATYQSFGVETMVDFNLFRFLPKFEVGVRSTYRVENIYNSSGMVFEFLIGNIGF